MLGNNLDDAQYATAAHIYVYVHRLGAIHDKQIYRSTLGDGYIRVGLRAQHPATRLGATPCGDGTCGKGLYNTLGHGYSSL